MAQIDPQTMSDEEMLEAIKADPQAFSLVYTKFQPQILGFFINRLQARAVAEDLTSQVFEKALRSISKFAWQGVPISAWLQRIARNALVDHVRAQARHKTGPIADEVPLIDNEQMPPDQQFEGEYMKQELQKLLQELPEKERKIVYLKFYNGYTNRVIAQVTGLSESNVGTIIYRAISKLRQEMVAQH